MAENIKETREVDTQGDARVYRRREAVEGSSRPYGYRNGYRRNTAFRVLFYLLNILEVLLGLRFLLRLLGANPGSSFVSFIYNITEPFIAPFRGIFSPIVSQGSVLEWSTIIAMIVYALAVYAIVRLVDIATSPA
jgi:uncharacterized protein YggT (Ycf19 family)